MVAGSRTNRKIREEQNMICTADPCKIRVVALQDKIRCQQRREIGDFEGEVSGSVTVEVSGDDQVLPVHVVAQLACD